jgi:hypothetical protein
MLGILGLCFRTADFDEAAAADMRREIAIYKSLRETLGRAAGTLLSPQAVVDAGPSWDVFQSAARGNRSAVVSAFQRDRAESAITVKPVGLRPDLWYEVRSVDAGILGVLKGSELMSDGVSIVESPNSAAHVLVLTAVPSPSRK